MTWACAFVAVWGAFYVACPRLRRPMWWVGLCTAPMGLTELFFIGVYWNPPTVFGLARIAHVDLESFLYCFGIGGVAAVLYNVVTRKPIRIPRKTRKQGRRQQWYVFAALFPFLAYLPLAIVTGRPLWAGIVVMIAGSAVRILLFPEMRTKTLAGGILFFAYYVAFLGLLQLAWPGYIHRVWFANIPGGWAWGVPRAELLFALTMGMFWSGIYEQVVWLFTLPVATEFTHAAADQVSSDTHHYTSEKLIDNSKHMRY